MNKLNFSKKVFCLITGASQGIGKQIAIEFAKKQSDLNSTFILMARNEVGLKETKDELLQINKNLNVVPHKIDLTFFENSEIENLLNNTLKQIDLSGYENAVIVHNAGSIGDVSKQAKKFFDRDEINAHMSFNVTSTILLNSIFMKTLEDASFQGKIFVINISSQCGQTPYAGFSIYSSGKAARDMYFKVLSLEEGPNTVVINYQPGPVMTNMYRETYEKLGDKDMRDGYQNLLNAGKVLTTEQTVKKLFARLEKGDFSSTKNVDYYEDEADPLYTAPE